MAAPKDVSVDQLVKKIEESQYGFNSTLQGPFGAKRGKSRSTQHSLDQPDSQHFSPFSGVHRLHCLWKVSYNIVCIDLIYVT